MSLYVLKVRDVAANILSHVLADKASVFLLVRQKVFNINLDNTPYFIIQTLIIDRC